MYMYIYIPEGPIFKASFMCVYCNITPREIKASCDEGDDIRYITHVIYRSTDISLSCHMLKKNTCDKVTQNTQAVGMCSWSYFQWEALKLVNDWEVGPCMRLRTWVRIISLTAWHGLATLVIVLSAFFLPKSLCCLAGTVFSQTDLPTCSTPFSWLSTCFLMS